MSARVRYGTRVFGMRVLEVGVYAGFCWEAAEWLQEADAAARAATLAEVLERGRVLASPPESDEVWPPVRKVRGAKLAKEEGDEAEDAEGDEAEDAESSG